MGCWRNEKPLFGLEMEKLLERKQAKKLAIFLFLLIAIPVASTTAYLVVTVYINVTVEEAISVTPSGPVTMKMHPKETVVVTFTFTNAANVDMETDYTISTSDPLVTATPTSGQIVVPATGTATLDVSIHANRGIKPGDFTVSVSIERPSE